MPCPHHDIKIVQRSSRQSAVAAAAYQSGERLFSEYDQKQKYYSEKRGIVHTEIMLPPHAPPEYADRNILWNAAETQEKQWNSQLARRIVLAIPREIPSEQHADLIRDYCREFFVSKGMIADFAIHDKGDGNPHAHILLTMRAMDETGKWLPKSRKVYDLDKNGERIRLPSGNWKSHKEDTVDWNDQKYAEIWRQGWAAIANRYLEANDRPERLDLRSYERQGLDKIPTVHMGPAVSQMEKRGIQTNIGNLNRDITAANRLMQSIRQMVRHLKGWIADLKEKKVALLEALQEAKKPTLPELLGKYLDLRREERTSWTSKGQLKGTVNDFNKVMDAIRYLREKELSTVESLDTYLDTVSGQAVSIRAEMKPKEKRMKEIDTIRTTHAKHPQQIYACKTYGAFGKNHCTQHRVEYDTLYHLVLNKIRDCAKAALTDGEAIAGKLTDTCEAEQKGQREALERSLTKDEERIEVLEKMVLRLYEDMVAGRISEANFNLMLDKTQKEQAELKERVAQGRKKLADEMRLAMDAKQWVDAIQEYADITELDAATLNRLIKEIVVHEHIDSDKTRHISIEIHFNLKPIPEVEQVKG